MQNTQDQILQNAPLIKSVNNLVETMKGTKFAKCDVDLSNGITIVGVTLHKQGDKLWVGLPAQEYLTRDYDKRFINIFRFSEGARERFQHEILAALDLAERRLV